MISEILIEKNGEGGKLTLHLRGESTNRLQESSSFVFKTLKPIKAFLQKYLKWKNGLFLSYDTFVGLKSTFLLLRPTKVS